MLLPFRSASRLVGALPLALSLVLGTSPVLAADAPGAGVFAAPGYAPAASAPEKDSSIPTIRNNGAFEQRAARPPAAGSSGPRRNESGTEASGEFQRFVETATGRPMPVFGASFFAEAAKGFAPVDNVPVAADYIVGPGDEVTIRAWGSIDVDYRATVDRNGQINLPKVGSFTVAGVKASELEKHLRSQISRLFNNFNLNVTLGQLRGVKVFVVGPARVSGVYSLSSQSTMLSAVVAAGGPGPNGSMRKVTLRRDGRVVSELDIYDFLVQGDKSKDVQLAAGDVVLFQPAGPRVALNGSIDNPGIYELKQAQEPLSDVLRYAGGSAVLTNPNRAQVERIDAKQPSASRFVEEFKLDTAGLAKLLRDGDVLTLLSISPEFANAVTLKGHVAQPLRYAYRPGMRIRDLIPNKEALISPEFYRRKNQLVQLPEEDPAERDRLSIERGRRSNGFADDPERNRKPPTGLFDELNWEYAVVERLNPTDLGTQIVPFNLGRAVLQGDEASNIELRPGDVVTVYSQKDIRVPIGRQTRLVTLEGEVGAPGIYQTLPGETLPQLLARAGGLTRHAYVYGLEFSREETRRRQKENLAEAIVRLETLSAVQTARDVANKPSDPRDAASTSAASTAATQAQISRLSRVQPNGRIALELPPQADSIAALPDIPLENSDRIVIPTRPGFVTVAGAVLSNNALLWKSGRTVQEYVDLAGLDHAAEPSQIFVLRADGTVITAAQRRGFLGMGGLTSERLYPGDTIIVPNKLDYETWGHVLVRNLKDWSQILSQFGLGAAAIQTLRNN